MHERVLLLRLEGPLQSWGTRARWDIRDSALEPTKSGIVGLLGAALGYPMYDHRLERLDGELRMGVRIDRVGTMITDFHTITDFLPTAGGDFKASGEKRSKNLDRLLASDAYHPATVISRRDYLEDASFLIALEACEEDSTLLLEVKAALRDPHWPPFLGRKSCIPSCPLLEEPAQPYASIAEALRLQPVTHDSSRPNSRKETFTAWIEDDQGGEEHQDRIRTNSARVYGFRRVRRVLFNGAEMLPSLSKSPRRNEP